MDKSIFDREVAFKTEELHNPFSACNALSIRARALTDLLKDQGEAEEVSPTVRAMSEYADGRIVFVGLIPAADEEAVDA